MGVEGTTRNGYEASGETGVRTEEPKGERRIREDVLPGNRGRWNRGYEEAGKCVWERVGEGKGRSECF